MTPKGATTKEATGKKRRRHGGRVVLSLDVLPGARDALRERAAVAGVSRAEYVSNAVARPERSYATTAAELGQPLTRLSYLVARAIAALSENHADSAAAHLQAAKTVLADALAPLARRHIDELRTCERHFGGWSKP
jgi:hypothetical protein